MGDIYPGGTVLYPDADFSDRVMQRRIHAIRHVGVHAYLIALAAWQRGLTVTFHYEFASHSKRFSHVSLSGYRGELFSVSDGKCKHDFYRALGDCTSIQASQRAESKPETRAALARVGLPIPDGVVVEPGRLDDAEPLLARYPEGYFVLKPLAGTLGRGVVRKLNVAAVRERLRSHEQPLLLECMIVGTEYRVYVTAGRVVKALYRRPASVEGDGVRSIRALVEAKAAKRRAHAGYHDTPLVLDKAADSFLAAQGLSGESVPQAHERVYLSDAAGVHLGGDVINTAAEELPGRVREIAERAAVVLDLPNVGLDMIVFDDADGRPDCVVIEANQNHYFSLTALAMEGVNEKVDNRVAESIIDHYFPDSVGNLRRVRASFDFMAICQILQSGLVAQVGLPVLGQDWIHDRLSMPTTQLGQELFNVINQLRLAHGVHAQLLEDGPGVVMLEVVAPEARWLPMKQQIQGMLAPPR